MTEAPKDAPPWFAWALKEIGTHELPENRGPAIRRYIRIAQCGQEGDPWCAIFANAALEASGIRGSRSASSQSYRHDKRYINLPGPALGALAVFWRGTRGSGIGHVGFYVGERDSDVWVLGGNEGDQVQIEALPKAGNTMGLVGYWWPVKVPMPSVEAVLMPKDAPRHETKVT